MTVRVVLVDDQQMIRMGLRMVLESQPGIEVVGEADDGDTALDVLDRVEADVVLMDVRMPRMNGVEATRRICAGEGGPRVLILTTFDLDEYAYDALQAGASGFLLKDTPVEDVAAAIKHIHAGDAVVAPSTTRRLLDHFTRSRPQSEPSGTVRLKELTPREHEVLILIARGLSNAEIAAELVLAEGTVKVHVGRILTKLGLRDRVQAVVLAYESGLVEAGER
ncbi:MULTISPECIES: response regulator transcription factor [unclassified Microbacterium]|uniref:response regulator n=1 Tax=unclassified Microbacterium TaxID=2609290 RepID=UPI000EA9FC2B|nr:MULTISPECIES: response regulator transcription factor [unclassified Microbacterium]MBT2486189.1 response regulator transcription factor [Microbacterium sp. ISL-108]RKN68913.1 DNA-binding response regulator [Microbacterium sp. CGR2]